MLVCQRELTIASSTSLHQIILPISALHLAQAGVRLIGGCCGTTPRHIQEMRRALDEYYGTCTQFGTPPLKASEQPQEITNGSITATRLLEEEAILPQEGTQTSLQQKLAAGDFVISIELDPPKGLNPTKLLTGAALLQQAGADFINIADSPMARVRMSCIALARLIQDHLGMETIIHFTTRDRNLMAIQSELLGGSCFGHPQYPSTDGRSAARG